MSDPGERGRRDPGDPDYKIYKSRPRLRGRLSGQPDQALERLEPPARRERRGGGFSPGRILRWLLLSAVAWIGLSLALFLVSAQLQKDAVSDGARAALDGSGFPLTSKQTVLVLGSDARTESTNEPGSQVGGPSRSDTILLMRTGGGASQRLSIPRDTIVDIPGSGRNKINAAYAIGGPALAIETVSDYLGIEINHLIEVNFENFPDFIDALGGIDYTGGCVLSRINGGRPNGGFTLKLKRGKNHLDGDQALALARTRKNLCNPRESDLTRARRQQKILSSIKNRLTSPTTFLRLPWVSWQAPKAIRSDMGGASLLGLFGAMSTSGSPPPRILRPSGGEQLPNGGAGLVVSEQEKRRAVERFLDG